MARFHKKANGDIDLQGVILLNGELLKNGASRLVAVDAVGTTPAFVEVFEHACPNGLMGIGTIKNTGGDSLEVKETGVDLFGTTDSVTTVVGAGSDHTLNPQANLTTARPPYERYKVEVRHPATATTFDLRHATQGTA